jgi:tryptophan synthase alpha chain
MNGIERLQKAFTESSDPICTAFITVGFPKLDSSLEIVKALVNAGAGIIELGIPFSDSLVDGSVIQQANAVALANGMTLQGYFAQVRQIRQSIEAPLVLMGALNPLIAYGFEKALDECAQSGIDGLIIPELPPEEFAEHYRQAFTERGLAYIPLITSRTPPERVRWLDTLASGFLYLVSGVGTTGGGLSAQLSQDKAVREIVHLPLLNPIQIGFGVRTRADFERTAALVPGVVVGSALLEAIGQSVSNDNSSSARAAGEFIRQLVSKLPE